MGGKEGLRPQFFLVGAVFQHGAGDAHAVISRRTSADLVQNEQGAVRRVFQNLRHLAHLHHKGGLSPRQIVRRSDAGENPVYHAQPCRPCRDKRADLRHETDEGNLPHIGGFARHIGAGDDGQRLVFAVHHRVVRDKKAVLQHPLHHGVPPVHNFNALGVVHLGHGVLVADGNIRQRRQNVDLRHGVGGLLNLVCAGSAGVL